MLATNARAPNNSNYCETGNKNHKKPVGCPHEADNNPEKEPLTIKHMHKNVF